MVKDKLKSLSEDLEKTESDLRFVSLENIHLTLSFLGNVEEREILMIVSSLKDTLSSVPIFKIHIQGVGVFPSMERIDVIWVGVSNGIVVRLIQEINRLLLINNPKEEIPHLTIARLKSSKNKERIREVVERYKNTIFGSSIIDTIILYESILTSDGPVYSVIQEFKLNSKN